MDIQSWKELTKKNGASKVLFHVTGMYFRRDALGWFHLVIIHFLLLFALPLGFLLQSLPLSYRGQVSEVIFIFKSCYNNQVFISLNTAQPGFCGTPRNMSFISSHLITKGNVGPHTVGLGAIMGISLYKHLRAQWSVCAILLDLPSDQLPLKIFGHTQEVPWHSKALGHWPYWPLGEARGSFLQQKTVSGNFSVFIPRT